AERGKQVREHGTVLQSRCEGLREERGEGAFLRRQDLNRADQRIVHRPGRIFGCRKRFWWRGTRPSDGVARLDFQFGVRRASPLWHFWKGRYQSGEDRRTPN